jgi:hypothetical protein
MHHVAPVGWLALLSILVGGCSGDSQAGAGASGSGEVETAGAAGGNGSGNSGTAGATNNGGSSGVGGSSTGGSSGNSPGGGGTSDGGGGMVSFDAAGTPPALKPGVWTDITPPDLKGSNHYCDANYGSQSVQLDPHNKAIIYVAVDQRGLWKSVDAGATWKLVGTPPAKCCPPTTAYIDSPIDFRIDPNDSRHMYIAQGVRGNTVGFWVSTDGGENWAEPPGFLDVMKVATNDTATMAVDPSDFNHVLLSSHSPWHVPERGVMETRDGGKTFLTHTAPVGGSATFGINFLNNPALGIGNSQTWIASVDGSGMFMTADSGQTWKNVSTLGTIHGGIRELYYTKSGVVYSGANYQMARSTDKGLTWTAVGPKFGSGYYQVIGDGNNLYAQVANTGGNGTGSDQPYLTSAESDGVTWTPYQAGAQKFSDGPYQMTFDAVSRIIYSANWCAGVWALKVTP